MFPTSLRLPRLETGEIKLSFNKVLLQIIFEYGRICGSNYCSEIEKHFVDIHLHLKNLEREKSQISVGVCSIQTHEEDEGTLYYY
ncbi:hypothetical protein Avbf_04752 [Armadillidium vulgare]|nr:hypothetical protein Avbf_04752 [Armadillidium vulgare]